MARVKYPNKEQNGFIEVVSGVEFDELQQKNNELQTVVNGIDTRLTEHITNHPSGGSIETKDISSEFMTKAPTELFDTDIKASLTSKIIHTSLLLSIKKAHTWSNEELLIGTIKNNYIPLFNNSLCFPVYRIVPFGSWINDFSLVGYCIIKNSSIWFRIIKPEYWQFGDDSWYIINFSYAITGSVSSGGGSLSSEDISSEIIAIKDETYLAYNYQAFKYGNIINIKGMFNTTANTVTGDVFLGTLNNKADFVYGNLSSPGATPSIVGTFNIENTGNIKYHTMHIAGADDQLPNKLLSFDLWYMTKEGSGSGSSLSSEVTDHINNNAIHHTEDEIKNIVSNKDIELENRIKTMGYSSLKYKNKFTQLTPDNNYTHLRDYNYIGKAELHITYQAPTENITIPANTVIGTFPMNIGCPIKPNAALVKGYTELIDVSQYFILSGDKQITTTQEVTIQAGYSLVIRDNWLYRTR